MTGGAVLDVASADALRRRMADVPPPPPIVTRDRVWSHPLLGAAIVNGARSIFTVAFPEYWLFFLGLMFILVTLFSPSGVIGLLRRRKP